MKLVNNLKANIAGILATILFIAPLATHAADRNPNLRTIEQEEVTSTSSGTMTAEQTARDALKSAINSIGGEVQELETAYGTILEDGTYKSGAFDSLKLKPSDKERLIKLANGSLTEREKETISYDANLMNLLVRLATPIDLGGGGFTHLRIGDLLRFKNDPRSKETEGADNISQHQYGKAVDILEINETHCTEKSLFGGSKDLPPFPVKVIWQGGAPYNPSSAVLSTFDASARSAAMRDILGTLPSDGYEGGNQRLEDILTSLQRRVIAEELGLDRSSLDYLTNNDFLLTLGQAVTSKALGYPTGSLKGNTPEEMVRSLPQAYLEDSLRLPSGSFAGDSVQAAIERLGRYKAAIDAHAPINDVLQGKIDDLKNSAYLSYYAAAEQAFNLPSGTLDGIKNNKAESFAAIGAQLIAQRLHYNDTERTQLIEQAKRGNVKQLSIARIGDISRVPLNVLPMIAPVEGSNKKEGEIALGKHIVGAASDKVLSGLPDTIRDVIKDKIGGLDDASGNQLIGERLLESNQTNAAMKLVGARSMEQAFDLPADSLVETLNKYPNATLDQFIPILGQKVIEKDKVKGAASSVGKKYVETTLRQSFHDFYHTTTVGVAKLSDGDMFSILVGRSTSANVRAGASWVEEDLGLAPDSFSALFADTTNDNRLFAAGLSTVGGNLFDSFNIDTDRLTDGASAITAIGQAKIETSLGLEPGSFSDSLNELKAKNPERFATVFAKPRTVDAIAGLDSGSTDKILSGSLDLATASTQVGNKLIDKALNTETLENEFGWDSRYAVDGTELLAGLKGTSIGTGGLIPGSVVPDATGILRKIGAYNTDYAFGWDPGTTEKWLSGGETAQNDFIVTQGSKSFAQSTLGLDLKEPLDLLNIYKNGTNVISGTSTGVFRIPATTLVIEAFKKRLNIPNIPLGEQVPERDILSLVSGDLPTVNYAVIAANQANQIKQKFDHAYQLYRIMISGSGSDPSFEVKISQEGYDRYVRVLGDIAQTKLDQLKDEALARVTNGVLNNGVLSFDSSPYGNDILKTVSLAYFSTKEARNNFLYGTIDAHIKKTDPDLPANFSKILMEGSNADRAVMIFDYMNGKVTDAVLAKLPSELRPLAVAWLNNQDITSGKILASNPAFVSWGANFFVEQSGLNIPEPAMTLLMQYATGTFDPKVLSANPTAALDISPEVMAEWVGNAMGLPVGQFKAYYDQYKQVQELYKNYQAGNLDVGQAIFVVDSLIFGGQLAEFTQSIDDALGLPGGSTQLLIQYAITGNPIYLAQFVFNLFFGTTIECPDLQQVAQDNVKSLVKAVIEQGDNSARLIPSQIIVYQQSYLSDLAADIRKNYKVCQETKGARCGVFARPEYAKQVHIGF